MADYREVARKYKESGFTVIPVTPRKNPTLHKWGIWQTRQMTDNEIDKHFKNCWGIALLTGNESAVICLDFDLKYCLRGDTMERYKELIPNYLLKKMYVQETMNGGIHFAFRVPENCLGNNAKLAARGTTAYERHQTYIDAFNSEDTREKATKIANNDRSRIIIETRDSGGYFLISPTPGYKRVYGKINLISEEEYNLLINAAISLNEVRDLYIKDKNYKFAEDEWKVNPFDDYNLNADVVQLLVDNGWEIIFETPRNVRFKRPGGAHSASSALFDKESRIFNVFSTSTSFDVNRGYNAVGVYAELECDNDMSLCFARLIELEYGTKKD